MHTIAFCIAFGFRVFFGFILGLAFWVLRFLWISGSGILEFGISHFGYGPQLFKQEQQSAGSDELPGGDKTAGGAGFEDGRGPDLVRANFVQAVVADASLNMNEGEANRVFTYMVDKVQELGLTLLPKEYLDQFGRLGGGDQEPQLPSEGSRPVEVEDLEKEHEDWDSSFPSTQGPGSPWTSGDESLETKLARVPHHEALAVATMHAINQEKKDRREEKKNDPPKASIRWSPLTKGGFEDFKYYCRHGVPLETLGPKKFEKVQDFETSQIQWGPITKEGVANFLGFGQANVNVENLDFMQLVDFAVGLKTFHDIPQDAPTHIQASIRYIKELYDYWNVWDVADIEGWLNEGWGPLLLTWFD